MTESGYASFDIDIINMARATDILNELELEDEESIVLIDARCDNKPSAPKA
jgi:hypothetical protein